MRKLLFIGVLILALTAVSCNKNDEKEEPIKEVPIEEIIEEEAEESDEAEEEEEEVIEAIQGEPQGSDEESPPINLLDDSGLSKEDRNWSWKRNAEHQTPIAYDNGLDLEKYSAHYKVDTQEKVIYLTFDEGYEYGFSNTILDILLENDVKAAFFVTKPFIDGNKDLVIRMKEEGHVVGNHSNTHPSFPTLTEEQIKEELSSTEIAFEEATGYKIDPFFRTPSGKYSEYVLYQIQSLGYKSIFWSLAYGDWDVNKQPGAQYVYDHIMENHHPGGIFLLHAVSQSNTEALDSVLKALKAEGYRFGSLYELK